MSESVNLEKRDTRYGVPDLCKAAFIIFSLNIILALWLFISPNVDPAVANQVQADDAAGKISPFTEVVNVHEKRRPVKTAQKLRPVLFEEPKEAVLGADLGSQPQNDTSSFAVPVAMRTAATVADQH